jgi:hypothetical protein
MAYVSNTYKVSENQLNAVISAAGDNVNWTHLLMVDYYYHHQENDYDEGLSFLDRLNHKLGRFHNWDVNEMKVRIKNSENPVDEYLLAVSEMLADARDVFYYGV